MGKGERFSLVSAGEQPQPSTVLQIFQEAANLLWRSRKPMLAILLILLLPQALIFFCSYLIITPLTIDMVLIITPLTTDPRSPEYKELLAGAIMYGVGELTGAKVAMMVISFLPSAFFVMAAVQAVAMAGKGEQATLKGLLCRIRSTWKGPVSTQLYVVVIYFGYTALLFLTIGALALISNGSMLVLALGPVIAILALLLLVYLRMVCFQGLVISVVEEGCSGLAALRRASELIRGRGKLGLTVTLVDLLLSFAISVVFYSVNTRLPSRGMIDLVVGLVAVYAGLLMSAFVLAAHVVFYHECERSHGEEVAMKESLSYSMAPTAPAVDAGLP